MEPTAGSTSSTDEAREYTERVALGRIVGAHGLRGQLRVRYFGGEPDHLTQNSAVWVAESEDDPAAVSYEVAEVGAGRRGQVRMALVGVEDRDSAERLRGKLVIVEAAQLSELPEGEYYSYQLVGCRVEGEDGREIGTVREVWSTGAPDVLVVEDEAGVRHLIPAAESLLREIDIDRQRIVIEILPGLLDSA
jgi:16S rRNA processing protein RimM